MISIIYGPDTYRSLKRLNQVKEDFLQKNGEVNLSIFEENFNLEEIKSIIQSFPFLGSERMVVFKNFFKTKKTESLEKIESILQKTPPSTHIIFWEEGEVEISKSLFEKMVQKEHFPLLVGQELNKWVEKEIVSQGGKVSSSSIDVLVGYVGNDLWQLSQEIQKLVNYSSLVSVENINQLVKANLSSNIFDMVDAIGQKNPKKAIKIMHDLLSSGENEVYLLTMIIRQIRNILLIKDALKVKNDTNFLAREFNLHPFVIKKTLSQINNFSIEELKMIYQKLLETDTALKTSSTTALPLDLLIVDLCTV